MAVLVITESKLDENIPTNLITIPGYHEHLRRDREKNGRNGGGVLVYIAAYLIFQQKMNLQSPFSEHVWVDVKYKGLTFAINALYRLQLKQLKVMQEYMQFFITKSE